jgi:membrane associated rhomboid family serine protease
MSEGEGEAGDSGKQKPEPALLLPGVVTALALLLVGVHLISTLALNDDARLEMIALLSFLPVRIVAGFEDASLWWPLLWTPFTHALLHDGWEHLLVNTAWLVIFATPVARRYGVVPTLAIFFISAAMGAAAFAATNYAVPAFLLGASGGVSGLTGAAARFMFQPVLAVRDPETGEPVILGRKLASFGDLLRDPRARAFVLIWVGLNAAIPVVGAFTGGLPVQIAWQAHIGGFLAGLLMVGLFERRS